MKIANITISPDVKALLPDVLIDWLCKLAATSEFQAVRTSMLVLTSSTLNGRNVQDIQYGGTQRRLFGFPPVTCKLQLLGTDHQPRMAIA